MIVVLCSQQHESGFFFFPHCKNIDRGKFNFVESATKRRSWILIHNVQLLFSLLGETMKKHKSEHNNCLAEKGWGGGEEGWGVTNYLSSQCHATIAQAENK